MYLYINFFNNMILILINTNICALILLHFARDSSFAGIAITMIRAKSIRFWYISSGISNLDHRWRYGIVSEIEKPEMCS